MVRVSHNALHRSYGLGFILAAALIIIGSLWIFVGCDGQEKAALPQASDIIDAPTIERITERKTDLSNRVNSIAQDPRHDTRPRIVAFGNSLTAGKGVAAQDAYPAQLQRKLDALGFQYQVVNAGVSGETTAGGVRRVDWVLQLDPKIVILELGVNDGLRGIPVKEISKNLEMIIEQFRAHHITVILAGMKLPLNYGKDYTEKFFKIYPTLAHHYHIPFIPFFLKGVAAQAHLNQADGVHPTAEGYRKIVDHNILPVLLPILKSTE